MAEKPSTKLLILCTAAVAAIYAGAYVYTEPAASASLAQGQPGQTTTGSAPSGASAARSKSGASSSSTTKGSASSSTSAAKSKSQSNSGTSSASTTSTSTSTKTAKHGYKDGTFTGSGSNVYGQLSVAVTIAGGKITNVRITSYAMHYPSFYISPTMNNEVVKMQTYQVYVVSGATASSYNFGEAVYYALQKAKA